VNLSHFWGKFIFDRFSPQKRKLKKIEHQHNLDKHLVSSLNKAKLPSLRQIKYLPKILSSSEKRKLSALFIIILLCLVALFFNVYFAFTKEIPKVGGEYSEGLIGYPRFVNPVLAQANDVDLDLSSLIFTGLMKRDMNNQLVPDLATSYEITADQLVYTFRLRNGVRWHDGSPFTADDVIFTIASIQDPQFKSPLETSLRGIAAEKVDDFTVKFTLKESYAPFLGFMTFGILPEHLWYSVAPTNADLTELNKKPIGTGAWKFESFKKDADGNVKSYSLVRNNDYYGIKPYLESLVFKFYSDFDSAVEGIKNKEVDGLAYLPKEYRQNLKKYKNLKYHNLNQPQYTAVFFNQKKNSLLAADYIRQVLALATDKNKIISQALNQEAKSIDAPTLPGVEPLTDIKHYDYNPLLASEILDKNGWTFQSTTTSDGQIQQVRVKKGIFLQITLTVVDQPETISAAELIKESWEQIGIKTDLQIVDKSKIFQDVIKSRNYQALMFGENLGSDPDPFPFWHSSQNEYPGLNLAIFSDKNIDKLLEDARKTNDWNTRLTDYQKFQSILATDLPAIFLYNSTYTYPQDSRLKGNNLTNISIPADRFADIGNWYVNTKRIRK